MLPPKNSIYRSWDSLRSFMGDSERRSMGSRSALVAGKHFIALGHNNQTLLYFTENDITLFRPTFKTKTKYADIVNPILAGFGWYYGDITFGPHRKYWRGLKPLNVSPGTPESDYRSIAPGAYSNDIYTLNWKGKITRHGGKLTEYQIKRCMMSYEVRAKASRRVRTCAYALGFPNTAKMNGFKLPKDTSPENSEKMNALARGYGFAHVAHAWANGFLVPTDNAEIEMLMSGMVHLVKEITGKEQQGEFGLYDPSSKLWLRQRPLDGEPPHDHSW